MKGINCAAIIGGGIMGTDIAAIFANAGWTVDIVEPFRERWTQSEQRVLNSIEQLGGTPVRNNLVLHESAGKLHWRKIGIVVECVPENLPLKQQVFGELEQLAPAGIPLASNSSSFPISEISKDLKTRERMLGLHFFMPAHLVPGVEVICGEATDPGVCCRVAELMKLLGKVPIMVKKDIPGFLANRIQHAMMREAFALIDAGMASPEDVDAAVMYGFGLRYLAAGPILQKDMAGLELHYAAAETIYPHLAKNSVPSKVLAERIAEGKYGMKTGEGFYKWTPQTVVKEKARYERLLLAALAILKSERNE